MGDQIGDQMINKQSEEAAPATAGVPGDAGAAEHTRRPGRARRWIKRGLLGFLAVLVVAGVVVYFGRGEYAYVPGRGKALNEERPIPGLAFDVWGRDVSGSEAERLRQDPGGRESLTPARGAVAIDEATLRLGRESFYDETFGNEFFMSDVVGMLDGPVRPMKV